VKHKIINNEQSQETSGIPSPPPLPPPLLSNIGSIKASVKPHICYRGSFATKLSPLNASNNNALSKSSTKRSASIHWYNSKMYYLDVNVEPIDQKSSISPLSSFENKESQLIFRENLKVTSEPQAEKPIDKSIAEGNSYKGNELFSNEGKKIEEQMLKAQGEGISETSNAEPLLAEYEEANPLNESVVINYITDPNIGSAISLDHSTRVIQNNGVALETSLKNSLKTPEQQIQNISNTAAIMFTQLNNLSLTNFLYSVIGERFKCFLENQNLDTGRATGDGFLRSFNIWLKGFCGRFKQKFTSNYNFFNYKEKHSGVVIGMDNYINDNNVLGFAYSNVKSNSINNSDRPNISQISTNRFSFYWIYNITEEIFSNSLVSYGGIVAESPTIDRFRIKGVDFSFKETIGYELRLSEGIALIPIIGVSYD
jgi:hypothetical protein